MVWSQDMVCKTDVRILEGTDLAFISSGTVAAENITIKMRECPVAVGYLLFCYRRQSGPPAESAGFLVLPTAHLQDLATAGLRIFGCSV